MRTCIRVPIRVPVYAYLYMRDCIQVPWYLVLTLGLPLCEYLPGTLVPYLPWILCLPCVVCWLQQANFILTQSNIHIVHTFSGAYVTHIQYYQ
eukprot:SAG11_NODE_19477_length_465_cov_4.890710_1_plen_92_part_10